MQCLSLVIGFLVTGALVFGTPSQTKANAASGVQAVNTLRLVNTAEAYARQSNGNYLSLPGLVSSGTLKQVADMNPALSSIFQQLNPQNGPDLLPGFDFALVVSSDGSSYSLSLVEKQSCGLAFFTDARGIIYSGKAMGCPQ